MSYVDSSKKSGGPVVARPNKEVLLSAYEREGDSLSFAGELDGAAAEFQIR